MSHIPQLCQITWGCLVLKFIVAVRACGLLLDTKICRCHSNVFILCLLSLPWDIIIYIYVWGMNGMNWFKQHDAWTNKLSNSSSEGQGCTSFSFLTKDIPQNDHVDVATELSKNTKNVNWRPSFTIKHRRWDTHTNRYVDILYNIIIY